MLVNACERNQLVYQESSVWNAKCDSFKLCDFTGLQPFIDPGVIQLTDPFNKLYGNGIKSTEESMIYFLEGQ